jgi:hypothetical protein
MNLSPTAINLSLGIGIIALVIIIFVYFFSKTNVKYPISVFTQNRQNILFFVSFFLVYLLFFSFLPRLSSKYYFYPSFAFWGCAAYLGNYFYLRQQRTKYILFMLLCVSLLFNYPAIKNEILDYRILGEFSRQFINHQAETITSIINSENFGKETIIPRVSDWPLQRTYQHIQNRGNLMKLLPIRNHSQGGMIFPENLIPIIFYPKKIVRWKLTQETNEYFKGYLFKRPMKKST